MSLSISCTEVVVARCSTELMLPAAISLSLSGGVLGWSRRRGARIRGFPHPIPSPLTGRVPRCYTFCVPCLILRSARRVGAHPPVRPPGEHEKGDLLAARSGKFLGLILPPMGTEKRQVSLSSQGQRPHPPRSDWRRARLVNFKNYRVLLHACALGKP